MFLRPEAEIAAQLQLYKQQLAMAIEEKYGGLPSVDNDLIIFSLIDKIETLFWVLGWPLPEKDLLEQFLQGDAQAFSM